MAPKTPSKTTQTTETILSPEQRELIQGAMGLARPVMGNPPQMPGVANANAQQTQAEEGILSSATTGAVRQNADKLGEAQNFLLGDVLDVNNNQGLQGAIQAAIHPLQDQFQQVIKPGLNHGSIGAGNFSSFNASKNTQSNALADSMYMRQVGDSTNNLINSTYSANLDAMTKGVGMAPQTQRAMLFPETAIGAVGDTREARQQLQGQSQFENEMMPFSMALQLLGAAGATPGGGSTGTVTGAQPKTNPFLQLLGAVGPAMAFL